MAVSKAQRYQPMTHQTKPQSCQDATNLFSSVMPLGSESQSAERQVASGGQAMWNIPQV